MAPLHDAVMASDLCRLRAALDAGDAVDVRNAHGITALMCASFVGVRDVVELLLRRGAEVNAMDERGWTPLHFCANKGSPAVASLLLAAGADAGALDHERKTAGDVAAGAGNTVYRLLLRPTEQPQPAPPAQPSLLTPTPARSPPAPAAAALEESEQRRWAAEAEAEERLREGAAREAALRASLQAAAAECAQLRGRLDVDAAARAAEAQRANEASRREEGLLAQLQAALAEAQQLRLELSARDAADAAREAEANAAAAAATAVAAASVAAACSEAALLPRISSQASETQLASRMCALQQLSPAAAELAHAAPACYAAAAALADTLQRLRASQDSQCAAPSSPACADADAVEASEALQTADASARALDARRAAVRRLLTAGEATCDASALRDAAEAEHVSALSLAVDACARLAASRRRADADAGALRAAADTAAALASALDDGDSESPMPRLHALTDVHEAARHCLPVLRDAALQLLPAAVACEEACERAREAVQAEAALLRSFAPRLAAALRAVAVTARARGGEAGGSSGDAGAAAAEALGAERSASLVALRAAGTARAAAAAAAAGLAGWEECRLSALQSLLDLQHERSTAQLKREWTPEREARYGALAADAQARVAAAESAAEDARRSMSLASVRELYPELAARLSDATATAALGLVAASSSGSSAAFSEAGSDAESWATAATSPSPAPYGVREPLLEPVEVLQRTPRCAVVRVRDPARPLAPHRVLKTFPCADSTFLAEARHLASARHPLVCALEAAYIERGQAHLLMPFYEGGSLRQWVEALKQRRGDFGAGEWAQVRGTLRQLLQALAFCHGRGIAHRDVKPENCLWRDAAQTQLVLCDFGLSRDLSRRLETTRALGVDAAGTPQYAAPEACGDAGCSPYHWKDAPWAVDAFSVGLLMLELACGASVAWSALRRRVQPLDGAPNRPLPLPLPSVGGAEMGDFLALALALTAEVPDTRPSADEALLHPFFCEHSAAQPAAPAAAEAQARGATLAVVAALLGELRVASRAQSSAAAAYLVRVSGDSDAEVLRDALAAAASASVDQLAAPCWLAHLSGARAPLSDLLRRAFAAAAQPQAGLLHRRCDSGPLLPAPGAPAQACAALGRLLARGMLEGVPCNLHWAPLLYAALLGREQVALCDATAALAQWAHWDAPAAAAARARLARHGASHTAAVLSEANAALWTPRAEALQAMAAGFCDVTDCVGGGLHAALALLDEWELGALLHGGAYVDTSALRASIAWDGAWSDAEPQRAFLDSFLAGLSEPSLRLFLARSTGRLAMREGGLGDTPAVVVVRLESGDAPRFPGNGVLALPGACPDAATFEARMRGALGLGAAASSALQPAAARVAEEAQPGEEPGADPEALAAVAAACCVCLSAPKTTLLLPCRHLCVCNGCATAVVERGSAKCPLCRAFIQARVMDVYI